MMMTTRNDDDDDDDDNGNRASQPVGVTVASKESRAGWSPSPMFGNTANRGHRGVTWFSLLYQHREQG